MLQAYPRRYPDSADTFRGQSISVDSSSEWPVWNKGEKVSGHDNHDQRWHKVYHKSWNTLDIWPES